MKMRGSDKARRKGGKRSREEDNGMEDEAKKMEQRTQDIGMTREREKDRESKFTRDRERHRPTKEERVFTSLGLE